MSHLIKAVPPTVSAGEALVDAWGEPAISVSYDTTENMVTVETEFYPHSWPGSQGDPIGPWRLVRSGLKESTQPV